MEVQRQHQSHWRDDGTCSYCGSLSPEQFFAAIEAGAELGPTDKNYKVYVHRGDPRAGEPCIYSSANFKPEGAGWIQVTEENKDTLPPDSTGRRGGFAVGNWVQVSTRSATTHDKFYFQHLSDAEQVRFVELLNAGGLTIGYPGRFYRLPFFVCNKAAP